MSIGLLFEKNDKTAKIRVVGRTIEVPLDQLPKGGDVGQRLEMDGDAVKGIVTPNPAQPTPDGTPMEMRNVHPDERSAIGAPSVPSEQNVRPGGPQNRAGQRQQFAMRYLVAKGWTPVQASGIVGRFMQESFPDLRTNAIGDAGISLGVGQWNKQRRQNLVDFAKRQGKSPLALNVQLDFFDWEVRNDPNEKRAFNALMAAQSPEEASQAMMHYERPQGYTAGNPSGGHGYKNTVRNSVSLLTAYDPSTRVDMASIDDPVSSSPAGGLDQAIEPPSRRSADSSSPPRKRPDFTPPDLSAMSNVDLGLDEAIAEGQRRIQETIAFGLQPQAPPTSTFGDFYGRYS